MLVVHGCMWTCSSARPGHVPGQQVLQLVRVCQHRLITGHHGSAPLRKALRLVLLGGPPPVVGGVPPGSWLPGSSQDEGRVPRIIVCM
jgi:hypothetical protein